jgi:hypothetical protein
VITGRQILQNFLRKATVQNGCFVNDYYNYNYYEKLRNRGNKEVVTGMIRFG